MEKNMQTNFKYLERRVIDSLERTDLEFIRNQLRKLKYPTILSGVGGSSVVSEFGSKVLANKNNIITTNSEPRDFIYNNLKGYRTIISCSYSGNNYGVKLSFDNHLEHYLLSSNSFDDKSVTYLKYETSIDKERSFISLGATLIPVSILLNYYLNGDNEKLLESLQRYNFDFDATTNIFEIFSGTDTSATSKYLESTLVEAGIGIPVVHDKYDYCHGRSTTSINYNSTAIYLNSKKELDNLLLEELKQYYENIVVLDSKHTDPLLRDYHMLHQAMYLTKYIAEQKEKDLSIVKYSPIVKKLYKYNGAL